MKSLLDGKACRTIIITTSNINTQSELETQLHTLRREIRKTSSTISNPVAPFAFEKSMNNALLQLADDFEDATPQQRPDIFSEELTSKEKSEGFSPNLPFRQSKLMILRQCKVPCIFGLVYISSGVYKTSIPGLPSFGQASENKEDKFQISLAFYPSAWIQALSIHFGMKLMISSSFEGIDCRMSTYRAVPDDAVIFDFCKEGNTSAVQKLFDRQLASPWDTNSRGLTPLFVRITSSISARVCSSQVRYLTF
jgi:hypothetical protein